MDYIEAFKKLKTNNRYSRKSPHKAVLLLTIIELYESCTLCDNVIKFDETLKSAFAKMWNKVLPEEATFLPEAYIPFWHMQSEEFWHIVPIRGKEDILTLLRDTHIKPSETKLKECVNYAEFNEDLYFLMTVQSGRSSLKRVLLETYTNLPKQMIDNLSTSSDNFIDDFQTAFSEYENILKSSAIKETTQGSCLDEDIEKQFYLLDEDIQYVLNIEYYTFLKKHYNERNLFKEICPTVFELYNKIINNPVRQSEISPSIVYDYENLLSDLKISLMSEDGSFELIDKINDAITYLNEIDSTTQIEIEKRKNEQTEKLVEESIELQFVEPIYKPEEKPIIEVIEKHKKKKSIAIHLSDEPQESYSKNLKPLNPAPESRKGTLWTKNEEELITLYYNQGYSFEDIAMAMGRTEVAIKSRLASLGLIDYSYENSLDKPEIKQNEDKPIDFYVENVPYSCYIFNRMGEKVYKTYGKFKILNGKIYRFNYKDMCFTVKDMIRVGEAWNIGEKKLVAYTDSSLYPVLDEKQYIEQIEDFEEGTTWEYNKICVSGRWYDYKGNLIIHKSSNHAEIDNNKLIENNSTDYEYALKGRFKCINDVVKNSYDYLWLLAIIDFMKDKHHTTTLSYDHMACMMIANAWEILSKNNLLKLTESSITKCIEFLIKESKEYMTEELDWFSPKEVIYDAIKEYPMAGDFEDVVDELLQSAPYNILKAWIKEDDDIEFVMYSIEYKNACLYALHPRNTDPYIEINPGWKKYLYNENDNLSAYFKSKYIEYKMISK